MRTKIHGSPVGFYFTGGFFMCLGLLLVGLSYIMGALAEESKSWPNTMGEMTQSEIIRTSSRNSKTHFTTKLDYSFEVSGKVYTGGRWSYGSESVPSDPQESYNYCEEKLRDYPVGAKVPVFYRPSDPTYNTLHTDGEAGVFFAVFGVIVVLIGSGGVYLGVVKKRRLAIA